MHPLLKRQIKKYLDEEKDRLSPAVRAFLDAADEAYNEADADRLMLERSLDLSSRELLQANSEMRAIFQSFPDLFFRLDHDGRILDCKGGGPGEFLISREHLIGRRIQDIPVETTRSVLREAVQKATETRAPVSVEYTLALRGEEKFYELRLLPILEDQLIAIVRDITERRRFAEVLLRQRTFMRQIIDQNPNFIFAKDRSGRFTLVNRAFADAYGTTVDELLGKTDADFNPNPQEVEAFRRDDLDVMDRLVEKLIPEEPLTDAAGNIRWVQTIKRPILSPDGLEQMVLGVGTDITARKLADEAARLRTELILRHQDALHELTLSGTEDLPTTLRNIVRVSARTLAVTRAGIWFLSPDRTEIIEEHAWADGQIQEGAPAVLSIETCRKYFDALSHNRTLAVSDVREDSRTAEMPRDSSGRKRIVSKLAASIRLHGNIVGIVCHEQAGGARAWTLEEEHFVASVSDLISLAIAADERRNLEQQLRQSQKIEAVGLLAGGVAHDFSNLLTVILVYADLLVSRMQSDPTSESFLEEIQKAATRAEALTRQLLAFSRKQVLNPKVLDLNAVVRSMEKMLRPMIGEDIEMITVLAPDLLPIKADRGQIEQVLMNLVVNARDAMPSGGTLRISTSNVSRERTAPHFRHGELPAQYVGLSVSDTGVGMDNETLSRVFEPFFTTKTDGKGSGLGLSTVFGIVDQSGGQIEVESQPGTGTIFRVCFPTVEERSTEVEPAPPVEVHPAARRENILLVEDEDSLRHAAAHALSEQGYRVLEVRNGVEAIDLCTQLKEDLHLVITDVVMPRMDGREMASHLARIQPNARILYVSGYAKGAILDKGALEPNAEFLAKPFRLAELIQKVREVLASSAVARSQ